MATLVTTIAGSPAPHSRSGALLDFAGIDLRARGYETRAIDTKRLPAAELVAGNARDPAIASALEDIARSGALIFATPVYKASFSGLLKIFLDLLPKDALHGKAVLPVATAGSSAHLLALDYALRPVLCALGAHPILPSVYAVDAQVAVFHNAAPELDPVLALRLERALIRLTEGLPRAAPPSLHPHPSAQPLRPALAAARCR